MTDLAGPCHEDGAPPRRAAAYIRKSSRSHGKQTESLEGQRRCIGVFARERGFEIVRWHVESESGTTTERRKVFRGIIEEATSGRAPYSYLICYDVSRFSRMSVDETSRIRYLLRCGGVKLVFATGGSLPDHEAELVDVSRQWLAAEFSRSLSESVCRGKADRLRLALEGKAALSGSGCPPYGYDRAYLDASGGTWAVLRHVHGSKRLVLDVEGRLLRELSRGEVMKRADTDYTRLVPSLPARVGIVQSIFRWYAVEGMGGYAIAKRLNQLVNRPTSGAPWTQQGIRHMLGNRSYVGDTAFGGGRWGRFFSVGLNSPVPREHFGKHDTDVRGKIHILRGTHEGIIPLALFEKAQQRTARRTKARRNEATQYSFKGLLRCGICGGTYCGKIRTGRKSKRPYYSCCTRKDAGSTACTSRSVTEHGLAETVLRAIREELASLSAGGCRKAYDTEAPDGPMSPRDRAKRLKHLRRRQQKFLDWIDPLNATWLENEMLSVQTRIDTIEGRSAPPVEPPCGDVPWEFETLWASADAAERNRLLRKVLSRVEMESDGERVTIWWSDELLGARRQAGKSGPHRVTAVVRRRLSRYQSIA